MNTLYLAWQDPESRQYYTVGRLDRADGVYRFAYTQGAQDAQGRGFTPLIAFPALGRVYESDRVFPLFANRVLPKSRPEFDEYVQWLSIPRDDADPVAILARTGGESVTDTLEIFPQPEQSEDGRYHVHFFVRGLRRPAEASIERAGRLEPGEQLLLMLDVQNDRDQDAVVLRTAERSKRDMHMLGYLPRYLASELRTFSRAQLRAIQVEVARLNPSPAPIHFRLLCHLSMVWPVGHAPFSDTQFEALAS